MRNIRVSALCRRREEYSVVKPYTGTFDNHLCLMFPPGKIEG